MTRWLPRSLFSRMVLVLLGGLAVAQFVSFAILWRERDEFMQRASGVRSAQRIADIVKLLDSIDVAERGKIVAVLDSLPLRITLGAAPVVRSPKLDEYADRAALFASVLQRALGDERQVAVTITDAPPWQPQMYGYGRRGSSAAGGRGMGPPPDSPAFAGAGAGPGGPGWMGGMGPGGPGLMGGMGPAGPSISFVVEVPLADGTPVTFDSRLPTESVSWPQRVTLSLAVLLAAVIVVTLFAVRWVTRPLKTLASAAEELGADINRPPLEESGPLEVRRAAHAFNTMQQRLAKFIQDRTRIFAAMSHDLKTPITRLHLRAELLDSPELQSKFNKDLGEMETMVSATLDFMRGFENHEAIQALDVMALLESLQADIRETGGEVGIDGSTQAPYRGQAQALRRCLANLIENAIKYGRAAKVVVEDGLHELRIRIQDEGPGIPESELESVFEPFRRLEVSRNRDTGGTGLGLGIARNIARNHGGDIALRNLPSGGLEALLTLPRKN